MKKYVKPEMVVVDVEMEKMIATSSMSISNDEVDYGMEALSNDRTYSLWD